jgi:hypothetical protein
MADEKDKTLGFSVQINGVSNEADQLAKITLEVAKLTKAKNDLIKSYRDGKTSEQDAVTQLAALTRELNTQKDAQDNLKKIVDTAGDSLNRMRATLIDLKDQYANGSASLRTQLTPEINKLTTQINTAEQAIGVHTRGVGNYTNSIKSAIGTMVGIAAPAAAAAFALNGLKTAFAGTEAGANLLGRAKLQMTAFFDAIVEGRWKYAFGNELPKDIKVIADLMNKVRIDERAELVAVSEKELEIKDLRLAAIKAGDDNVQKVKLLAQAEQIENDLIQVRLNYKGEELDYVNKIIAKDPQNTAALNQQAQLQADINNILGDRSLRLASQEETAQKAINKELDKTLSTTETIALKAKLIIDKGLTNQNPIMGGVPTWTMSDEVTTVNYKNHVKNNIADIGDIIDKANKKLVENQTRQDKIELEMEQKKNDMKLKIAQDSVDLLNGVLETLFGKSKLVQATELVAEKALAIAQIIIHTQEANAAMKAWGATYAIPTFGGSIAFASAMNAKNQVAEGISIAAVIAATAAGLVGIGAGKAKGGRITKGYHVNTGTVDDTLIVANKTETVLTRDHVARLGGSGVMRQIGVPGYAMGGYVGSQTPHIAPAGFNTAELERVFSNRIDRMEVILNVNKVRSASHELDIINTTNKL